MDAIRLFVSSTFEDLSIERKYLAEVIFPPFKLEAKRRNIDFYEIDLRWGLRAQAPIIKSCLREIELTKPYFMGIIGRSDGTVPTLNDLGKEKGVYDEYDSIIEQWIEDGCGITEMEIRYCIEKCIDKERTIFFWLDYYPHTNRQIRLAEFLQSNGYTIVHCESQEDFGNNVAKYLRSLLPIEASDKSLNSWFHEYRRDNVSFAFQMAENIAEGTCTDYSEVCQFVYSEDKIFLITGESGVGKTTFLANLVTYPEILPHKKLIFDFFLGNYIDEIYDYLRCEFETILGRTFDEISSYEGLINITNAKDKCIEIYKRIHYSDAIVILDGIEQIGSSFVEDFEGIDNGVKFIISTNENPGSFKSQRLKFPVSQLGAIIENYYRPYNREFPREYIPYIQNANFELNYNSLMAVLNELRTFSTHNNLVKDIKMLVESSEKQLYDHIISHWSIVFPYIKSSNILYYIAISHYGLSEGDLKSICNLSQPEFTMMYSLILPYVDKHGNRLRFKNEVFKQMLIQQIPDVDNLRNNLCQYFSNSLPLIKFDEVLYQTAKLGREERVISLLLDLDIFHFGYSHRRDELMKYWGGINDDDIEFFDYHIFLSSYGIDVLTEYVHSASPRYYEISKAEVLAEVLDFIQFNFKPFSCVKYECDEVCEILADAIFHSSEKHKGNSAENFIKGITVALTSSMRTYMDVGDSKKAVECTRLIISVVEPRLYELLDFYEMHQKLSDTFKKLETSQGGEVSLEYGYNLLNIPDRLRAIFPYWLEPKNYLLSHSSSIKRSKQIYKETITVCQRIRPVIGTWFDSYLAVVEYSMGYSLYFCKNYKQALFHFERSLNLRIDCILPKDSSEYQKSRFVENVKMRCSCLHYISSSSEELELNCASAFKTYFQDECNPYIVPIICQSYLNSAFIHQRKAAESKNPKESISNFKKAIKLFSKVLDYTHGDVTDREIKIRFYRLVCCNEIGEATQDDSQFIRSYLNMLDDTDELSMYIKSYFKNNKSLK